MPGQVNLDSELGRTLHTLARESDVLVCVEIGTWNGEGSTFCLAQGLHESSGRLISIELDSVLYERAVLFYSDEGSCEKPKLSKFFGGRKWAPLMRAAKKDLPVEIINGVALAPEDYPDPAFLEGAASSTDFERADPGCFSRWYEQEHELARNAGRVNVLRDIVENEGHVDLAFLDGGEFTSTAEFIFLEPHIQKYVVLDDTNPAQSIKNVAARAWLHASPEWDVVRDELHDRNGWLVARRRSKVADTP